MIATAIREQFEQGRKVLILTERTDYPENLQQTLADTVELLEIG
ncbi:hypothetical protein [Paraburkholderia sp. 32]